MEGQEEYVLKRILDENKQSIYRICRIYAVSPIEPQDLFQEVVIQIWKSLPSFKKKSSINTWIYKIAINVCTRRNQQIENSSRDTVSLKSIEFKLSESPTDTYEQEKYKALYNCISCLEESDQKIMVLYLEELAYKEIAEITNLTENHIAVKMKRIRKKLLDCITPKLK
ncbi:sigma-70 family RNA polymerase sigma factor [Flavobacteriaceae bacterium KMM 6897]|nr:sigma-70 family RNA polymerase sigma factor [Flavobacteriaceae bacterium KMM 6897]MEB8344884.1 sigma-70 family RNA polymerase sigma factor [Flavobacteriaceae bacterium KMM 6898]